MKKYTHSTKTLLEVNLPHRWDLLVQSFYAEHQSKSERSLDVSPKYQYARYLYKKMRHIRCEYGLPERDILMGGDSGTPFDDVIKSIKTHGFKEEFPITLNRPVKQGCDLESDPRSLLLVDGSHRLSCCLAFDIKKIPVIYDPRGPRHYGCDNHGNYGKNWFSLYEGGGGLKFSEKDILFLKQLEQKYTEQVK